MSHSVLNRLVRAFNIFVLLAILVLAAAAWRFAIRPLAQTAGPVDAPVLAGVTIVRDATGMAHIRASNLEDALFAQGYVLAQDRLFQMDGMRRQASGTLSEIVGARTVEADKEARRLRMRRMAEAAYTGLPEADRAALAAYARGVNHFIATHLDRLPLEFSILRYDPRPWSAIDSLLIGLEMLRTLSSSWRDEINKRALLAGGDARKVDFLFPVRTGGEVQPGSNAWAIAGSRTASGKPLLSSDMHLAWSLPNLWYMAHLQAPGLDVAGVALPGVPGIVVGHNRRITWAITNLHFDVQDLYQEKIDDRTGRYLFRGQVEQARLEREFIEVKGGQRVEVAQWVTRHGPIMINEGSDRLALRWTAAEPGALQVPLLDINRAGNWTEFRNALRRFHAPGSNFVYADADGNIGYQAAGLMPIRRKHRGDVPADGSSGENEWDGFIPFDRLPSVLNPPSGMIVSANQNPFPEQYEFAVAGNFAPYFRSRQIHDRLAARGGWKADELLSVQTDVYSGFSRFLAAQLAAAYERRNSRNASLDKAVGLLRSWNGQMASELAAPFLVSLAYQHLRAAVAENASPGKGMLYEYPIGAAVIDRLLRERPAGWFRDWDEVLLRALVDAVEEGERIQGRNLDRWRYGQWIAIGLNHPVLHSIPVVGPYFDLRPVPASGSSLTVKQTSRRVGPSMRMNADLADWERSLLNLPVGQSGQAFSSHYKDQWKPYWNGTSYPMQFGRVEAKDTLELRPK